MASRFIVQIENPRKQPALLTLKQSTFLRIRTGQQAKRVVQLLEQRQPGRSIRIWATTRLYDLARRLLLGMTPLLRKLLNHQTQSWQARS